MKRKLCLALVLLLILANIVAMTSTVFAEEIATEGETITISYINDSNTINNTTSLDTTAYSGGKQTVGKGEKFTLPTTSNTASATEEGYQLVWYTRDGRTYKAGEEVSFEEDTSLYRVAAKECYTATELGVALNNGTKAGILMADLEATGAISFPSWSTGIIIMNGFNINFKTNSSALIGEQRTQRHFYGEGTINVTNPDGKVGAYYFLRANNHGYAGDNSRTVIGRDVTINAPNHYLTGDEGGDIVNRYVWTKIYGTINCYGLFYRPAANNCGAFTEFFDTCNVTFTGDRLIFDANSNGKFNYLGVDIAIYGGTFNLPAASANESFWTNDNLETITNYDGSKTYTNVGLTQLNKDNIKIYGGSFVTADGSMPAIADYVANTYTGAWKTGGNGIITNNNTSTYEVSYKVRPGIKLVFTTYSDSALGTITVTDYVGSSLKDKTFKYRVNTLDDGSYEIVVYESRMDGETEVWDVVSDELAIKWGNGGTILVSYDLTRENIELHGFEANNQVYQTVVPADCEHSFTGAPVDATCQEKAYADYNCSVCGHNVYFSWGEKAPHAYEQTAKVEPTTSTHGSTTFACSTCGDTKTYATTLDPATLETKVTIKNDDGTFEEITVLANEVFEFSTNGGNGAYIYTLVGIKAFGEYNIRNIYGAVIPSGIMYVNITTQNLEKYNNVDCGLEVLETEENATITIHNFGNLSCLKTFKVGKGSTIVIEGKASYFSPTGENRSNSNLETVDFSAGNMNVTVMGGAFQDRPVSNLLLGANSVYDFQYDSFRNIKATELEIPSSITLTCGTNAFRDADFTSLKFPDGTADAMNTFKLGGECFRYCPIESLEFGQYGTYTFDGSSFSNLKFTHALTFAPNSTYTVNSWAFSNNSFTEIDASAGNITLTVNGSGLRNLTNVTEFKFGENSTYYFAKESLGNTTYTKLTLAPNSSYTFIEYFLSGNTTFKEIDASADNITITFNSNCLNGITTFDTLTFGKNATLSFNQDCFKGTALSGLELGENYTITFNGYSMRDFAITELNIKKGSTVTFAGNWANGSTIEALTLAGDSNYTFNNGSLNYTTLFTELIFQENTTCRFKDWALNNNSKITKIDLSASGVNVTLDGSALRNAYALTTVLLNGNNATYVINNNAFNADNAITNLRIDGENSTYTFDGSDVFKDMTITELVLGKNSTYTFSFWMVSGSTPLQRLDASAEGVNVTFAQNAFRGKSTLTELLINGKNATYTFINESFRECSGLTEIVLGEGSTYDFREGCFSGSNNFTKFDGSANGITASLGNYLFQNRSKLAEVIFGSNSNYTIGKYAFSNTVPTNDVIFAGTSTFSFGQEAFRYADFTSITFEDGCKVTFTGSNAFLDCDKATSLYIGKNIAITNSPFRNLKALETLYIMEGVTNTSEYEFEHAGSSDFTTPLYVYNHSTDLSFNKGMFNNCDGIVLYTVTDNIGTRTDLFSNCSDGSGYKAWTVYLGIPHPMVEGLISDPTCDEEGITGWVSDENYCNCGFKITETMVVNKYENKHNITESTEVAGSTTYAITTAPAWGHDYGVESPVRIDWIYVDNNYFENAKNKHTCTVCGEDYLGKDIENSALFTKKGTTLPEDVKDAIAHALIVNIEAINAYNEYLGEEFAIKYGVVAGIALETGNPVTPDGKANANGKAVVAAFENTAYSILQLKITNISNANQGLYCSAYVIIDGTVFYIHNGAISDTAIEVSLNEPDGVTPKDDVVESIQVEAVVDNKETIYA